MTSLEVWALAAALSADAIVAAFSYGLIIQNRRTIAALKIALTTGAGQFIMPILGWFAAQSVYGLIAQIDHWLAFAIFLILGIKVMADARRGDDEPPAMPELTLDTLLLIGVATSIDAFVSGSMLYVMGEPLLVSALIIGGTTFVLALAAFSLCRLFKNFSLQKLETASGLILIALGCKILCEHLISQ